MKSQLKPGPRRFELQLLHGHYYYIDRVVELEKALARRPRELQIDMVGTGEVPADFALLIRSVLLARRPRTRLVTNARSSLKGASALVWLLGDRRLIRDDAKLYFRPVNSARPDEARPDEAWKDHEPKYRDSCSELDPEEGDYARVLQLIDEYLPVKELAGLAHRCARAAAVRPGGKREGGSVPVRRSRQKRNAGHSARINQRGRGAKTSARTAKHCIEPQTTPNTGK